MKRLEGSAWARVLAFLLSLVSFVSAPAATTGDRSPPPEAQGGSAPAQPLGSVDVWRVHVQSGAIEPLGPKRMSLREAGVRAIVAGTSGSAAGIWFTYRGPSRGSAPLTSGELRRQIGIKLRAQDTCNVVYVMWRIAPSAGIHVQVKSNPGQKRHQECRDRGYQTIRPRSRRPVPDVRPAESHSLDGFIDGGRLRVFADGVLAWDGTLPDEALAFAGPAGFRSDNGEFDVELRAGFDED